MHVLYETDLSNLFALDVSVIIIRNSHGIYTSFAKFLLLLKQMSFIVAIGLMRAS